MLPAHLQGFEVALFGTNILWFSLAEELTSLSYLPLLTTYHISPKQLAGTLVCKQVGLAALFIKSFRIRYKGDHMH